MLKFKKTLSFLIFIAVLLSGCSSNSSVAETADSNDTTSDATTEITAAVTLENDDRDKVSMPNVIGIDQETAKNIIIGLGLVPNIQKTYSDVVAEGNISEFSPAFGDKVAVGDQVNLYVSEGAETLTPVEWSWTNPDTYAISKLSVKSVSVFCNTMTLDFTWNSNYDWNTFATVTVGDTSMPISDINVYITGVDDNADICNVSVPIPLDSFGERKLQKVTVKFKGVNKYDNMFEESFSTKININW